MIDWNALIKITVTPLGPVGLVALVSTIFLYGNLSRRLGAVTKMPSYYRWFLVSSAFLVLATSVCILRSAAYLVNEEGVAFLVSPEFGFLFFHIPLFVGATISVIVTWYYWSWLLSGERTAKGK